jgi:hypothetical protein
MNIELHTAPIGFDGKFGGGPKGELTDVDNGDCVVTLAGGRVFSVQPGGQYADRDPGTKGGYERCRKASGGRLHFLYAPVDYQIFYRAV